ncbi:MAG: methyltransferase domain-containing protein [Crenarchaeota archaeon]|nr:methyltransferase domain-containing protein [Thermoproteota archaeon]
MYEVFDEIFKNNDVFNPVSLQTLIKVGKLANLNSEKTMIDLGCGKGWLALFLAGSFGVHVEGYDIGEINVKYANERAKLLNLSSQAQFFCQDLKDFLPNKKYDVVTSLGIEAELYGGREAAFELFRNSLKDDGCVLYTEPVWTKRPVPANVLEKLKTKEESFLTIAETQQLIQRVGYQELAHFISTKEDWAVYLQGPIRNMQKIIETKSKFAEEVKIMLEGFKMEYEAANNHWDVVMWVLKPV